MFAFSSMETTLGGRLRASVSVVLARKNGTTIGSGIYKAIYDITANSNAVWHNTLGHLEKAKGWAIHQAMSDFRKNRDLLMINWRTPNMDSTITATLTNEELLATI